MRSTLLLAAALTTLSSVNALAFDPEAGAKVFKKCATCHKVGPDAKNATGPTLNGLLGRPVASLESFASKYSKGSAETLLGSVEAAAAAGEPAPVWDYAHLAAFLANPKEVYPRTRMAFSGLRNEQQIKDVIAYLASFDADGAAVDPQPVLEAAGAPLEGGS